MKKLKLITLVSALALTADIANAQDSALLDLLVKKKVITAQEAEETHAELAKEYAATPAGKINLSTPVKQLKLYGDARVRYEWREGNAFGPNAEGASDTANADRFRYRLRLGADVTLTDQWFLGISLETSNNGRSTNVTESSAGTNIPPFGKAGTASSSFISSVTTTTTTAIVGGKKVVTGVTTSAKPGSAITKVDFGSTIFVGQLYLKYKPFDWLTLEGGKIPNPFVCTPMVWEPNINPEGFAEQFKTTIGPFGGTSERVVDLFANFGQFVYDTASPQNQFGTSVVGRNDTWLLGWQAGAKVNFNKNLYLQLAPTFYNYTGKLNNDFSIIYSGDPGGNQTGINDLAILDVPAEFGWRAFGIPFTLFGDFAYNVDSPSRATAAGHTGHTDGVAWQAGLGINKIKKKGDWSLAAYYQYSGAYALDPNLIAVDIFDAHLNFEGVVFKAAYALTDAVSLGLQYNYGQIIDTALGTGGAGGTLNGSSSSPALRNYNLLQLDFNIKF